jgi:hypothetical protein
VATVAGTGSMKLNCASNTLQQYTDSKCTQASIGLGINGCISGFKYYCRDAPAIIYKGFNATTDSTCAGEPLFVSYQPEDVCQSIPCGTNACAVKYAKKTSTSWTLESYTTADCSGTAQASIDQPGACSVSAGSG